MSDIFFAGIDMGSTTVAAVVIDIDGAVRGSRVLPTGVASADAGQRCLADACADAGPDALRCLAYQVATGYGRVSYHDAQARITEITCQARGVAALFPAARTVLDVGGQDAKAIRLNTEGKVLDFAMNDKCAAGTGRFMEVTAQALRLDLTRLADASRHAAAESFISSTCAVFAESEVVGLVARGEDIAAIARGLHRSLCKRFVSLLNRVGIEPDLVFTGGVALNAAIVDLLAEETGLPSVTTPAEPQLTCALGAALIARDKARGCV